MDARFYPPDTPKPIKAYQMQYNKFYRNREDGKIFLRVKDNNTFLVKFFLVSDTSQIWHAQGDVLNWEFDELPIGFRVELVQQ